MKNRKAAEVAKDLFDDWKATTEKHRKLDIYATGGRSDELFMPSESRDEHAQLNHMSNGGYGESVVTAVSQQQYVETHRRATDESASEVFKRSWNPNGMAARQLAIHRGANATGQSFCSTLPGRVPGTDLRMPIMRGHSSTKMVVFYDRHDDEFGTWAMEGERKRRANGEAFFSFRLMDDEKVWQISTQDLSASGKWVVDGVEMIHDVGVLPVHRFVPRLDLEGRTVGEIERIIPTLRRLDQDILDRMIVQRFGAWRIKYATGLAKPKTAAERKAAKMMLSLEHLLISEKSDSKFGTLEPSPLDGYIKAREADERVLSVQTQIPAYQLSGTVDNVSAEGLDMMQAGLKQHAEEIRTSFGQTWDQIMRTNAYMLEGMYPGKGFLDLALDYETTTIWRDTEIRSLEHAANALGKLSTDLGIPPMVLLRRIPGWTAADQALTESLAGEAGILDELRGVLAPLDQQGATGANAA